MKYPSLMDPDSEQILIEKAKNGDTGALATLWDHITPRLFGYIRNTVRNTPLAEDILQTTWLKAMEALPRFEPRGNVSAWLFAIARNECRQHWRATAAHPVDQLIEEHDTPNDDHHTTETQLLVEQALNSLSVEDRELIRLRYIADLPVQSIAKVLNINSVTARVRLHRAIARAQTILSLRP